MNNVEFEFCWEGASSFSDLRVLEARGTEGISEPFEYSVEVASAPGGREIDPEELVGKRASLRITTHATPAYRWVHGTVMEADEAYVAGGSRIRLLLAPTIAPASQTSRSRIFLEKSLREIVDFTCKLTSSAMSLQLFEGAASDDNAESSPYTGFTAFYQWRCRDVSRLDDPTARPYVVQYNENDVDFVFRLLEEEGISYHYECTTSRSILVFSDHDGGRQGDRPVAHVAPGSLHHDALRVRRQGRVKPRGAALLEYEWRNPGLAMHALSESAGEDGTTQRYPGGFLTSPEEGAPLAAATEERFRAESRSFELDTSARTVAASSIISLEHPAQRMSAILLARRLRVELKQRESFSAADGKPEYHAHVECVVAAPLGGAPHSMFRPPRTIRKPLIVGSQTAVVTAEPNQEQEINVGGDADIGCVRVRFHWDIDTVRHSTQATSTWVRVSQMFAGGRGHGALFHPRVGDEVIVEHLEGDPDRPIIVGRVYNGRNLAPEDATARPTYSAIKSMTSPFNGNFNMIAFDDLQGEEKFIVHVAKDYISNIKHNSSRTVCNLDVIHIMGDQKTTIEGTQEFLIVGDQTETFGSNQTSTVNGSQFIAVGALQDNVINTRVTRVVGMDTLSVGAMMMRTAGAMITDSSPMITIDGSALVRIKGGMVNVSSGSSVNVTAGSINLNC